MHPEVPQIKSLNSVPYRNCCLLLRDSVSGLSRVVLVKIKHDSKSSHTGLTALFAGVQAKYGSHE